MAQGEISPVQRFLRRVRATGPASVEGDGQCLDCFLATGDQAAFAALVQRHGPMVLSVCRRVLPNLPDAEDAFQATFLVLARKAASIRKRGSLSSWLYGVAYRIARKAQEADMRRRAREKQVPHIPQQSTLSDAAWRELRTILDQELDRLPEKYRAPLVLCYLEGKTNEEAARQLGWTKGTVSGRLACARERLRQRLTRRGLALSAGMLVGLFGAGTAPAAVPGTLQAATVEAAASFAAGSASLSGPAAALAQGVIQAMFIAKCKIISCVLVAIVLIAGGSGVLAGVFGMEDGVSRIEDRHFQSSILPPPSSTLNPQSQEPAQPVVQPPKANKNAQKPPNARDRMTSMNNLKQIALAMHNFHSTFNKLPAQAIFSKDGKPLLSWRVLILPYIEQEKLYQAFRLNEPWDSEHNKKLLAQMPEIFAPPGIKTKEKYTTFYRVFVGPGAIFEGNKGINLLDIKDGTFSTVLAVEAGQAVPWTRPDELPFDPKKALPKLGGIFNGDFNVLLADGAVRFVRKPFNEEVFRAMITRSGGEVVNFNDLEKKGKAKEPTQEEAK